MNSKSIALALIWLTSCLPSLLQAAQTPFAKYLPENTLACVQVNSISELKEAFTKGDAHAFIKHPEIQAFFKPSIDKFQKTLDSAVTKDKVDFEQLERVFKGQATVAFFLNDKDPSGKPGLLVMLDYAGTKEELKEIVKPISDTHNPPADCKVDTYEENFMNEVLYVEEVKRADGVEYVNGYALVNGIFLIGDPLPVLKDAVANIKNGGMARSLSDNTHYIRFLDTNGSHSIVAFLNLEFLVKELNDTLLKELSDGFEKNPQALMAGVTPIGFMDAVALNTFQAAGISIGTYREHSGARLALYYREKKGLLTLLSHQESNLTFPDFIPANALAASISSFNIGKTFIAFEALLSQVSPMLGQLLEMQLQQYKLKTGLDIKENVINNIGDEMISVTYAPKVSASEKTITPEELHRTLGSNLYGIRIRDPKALKDYINALQNVLSPTAPFFEKRDYMGIELFTPSSKMVQNNEPPFGYAITDQYLLISTPGIQALQEAIAQIKQTNKRDSLNETAHVKEALQVIGNPLSELSYGNRQQYVQVAFELLAQTQSLTNKEENALYCNPQALPKNVSIPYYTVGGTRVTRDALISEFLLFRNIKTNP